MKKIKKILATLMTAVITLGSIICYSDLSISAKEGDTFSVNGKTLKVGDYFEMGTYFDEPILWRCIAYDENGPLMLSDKILCMKAFDASGNSESGSHGRALDSGNIRKTNGSNYWGDSNLKDWLNSDADAGNVVWSCGNPPDAEHLFNGYMPYDKSAGFLNDFTCSEKNAIKTVRQKQILDRQEYTENDADNYHIFYWIRVGYASIAPIEDSLQNYDTAYCEYSDDKVFLLDIKQAYDLYMDFGDYLAAVPTKAAVTDVRANSGSSMAYVHEWSYWLRTPCNFSRGGCNLRTIRQRSDAEESFDTYGSTANDSHYGVRPAFYLDLSSSDITYGSGSASDPYGINRTKPITSTTTVTTTETTTQTTTETTTAKTTKETTTETTTAKTTKETTTETTTAQTTTAAETTTEITTSSYNNENTLIFGDADGNNVITLNDAVFVLQKILSSTFELPIEKKSDEWFMYIDVDSDKNITARDSALILKKTHLNTFEFPAEKKYKQ